MNYEAKLSLLKQWEWEYHLLVEVKLDLGLRTFHIPTMDALRSQITILSLKIQIAKEELNLDTNVETV